MSRQGLARHNPRRDENERIIVQALEARGFHVDRISGAGIPDLLVSRHGSQWLIEIKRPKGTYTPKQIQWRAKFQGPAPWTLRTVEDALRFPEAVGEPVPAVTKTRDPYRRRVKATATPPGA